MNTSDSLQQPPMYTVNLKHDCVFFFHQNSHFWKDYCNRWYIKNTKRKQKTRISLGIPLPCLGHFKMYFQAFFYFLKKLPNDLPPPHLSEKFCMDPPLNYLVTSTKTGAFHTFSSNGADFDQFVSKNLKTILICTLRRNCNCLQESSHNGTGHLLCWEGIVAFLWIICK